MNKELTYKQQKELIELEKVAKIETIELAHKYKMEELKQERDFKMEVERVKTAEIRKSIDRKKNREFMENYTTK